MSGVKINLMSNSFPSKTLVVITSKGHHKVAVVVVVVITHHAMERLDDSSNVVRKLESEGLAEFASRLQSKTCSRVRQTTRQPKGKRSRFCQRRFTV